MKKKPIIYGSLAGFLLLILYFGIVTWANSFQHALEEFGSIWYWIALLVLGFSIQAGLYVYIRQSIKRRMRGATAEVATAGGISTGSMIACCAHHLTDVLPILGFGAAAMFLTQYQTPFILLGVFSNLIGIIIMLQLIQKHNLAGEGVIFNAMKTWEFGFIRNGIITVSLLVIVGSFLYTNSILTTNSAIAASEQNLSSQPIPLEMKNNSANRVSIDVKPIKFTYTEPVTFGIALNTHSGSLDYDLTEISILICDQGYEYAPLRWEGPPPGGHHRRGELVFPAFNHKVSGIQLVIKGIYDVPERVFEWTIEA